MWEESKGKEDQREVASVREDPTIEAEKNSHHVRAQKMNNISLYDHVSLAVSHFS